MNTTGMPVTRKGCMNYGRTVEVFRTSVPDATEASLLLRQLRTRFPDWIMNFDLSDCDRVLRVESPGATIDYGYIENLLQRNGYHCEPLPD